MVEVVRLKTEAFIHRVHANLIAAYLDKELVLHIRSSFHGDLPNNQSVLPAKDGFLQEA